ncbi:MAG: leucine--tRNA ligase, partial [Bdellovibrionota bacterium]
SERGGHPVFRVKMRQWMLKITAYAERLLTDLDLIDWPEATKEAQRNWIGKSEGADIRFSVAGTPATDQPADQANQPLQFEIFTTRPDTIYGATFMVLAPEHPLVKTITTAAQSKEITEYTEAASRKSEMERKATVDKTGVFTGAYAINPFSKKKLPIWIADYVLMDYGTGAIMAVPAHDARDFEFATKFKLPIEQVLSDGQAQTVLPFEGEGTLVNSDFLNGLKKTEAIQKAIAKVEADKIGTRRVQYKLRDWLFSRQRYWGEPIPIVYNNAGQPIGLSEEELPLTLPQVADYQPSEKGEPPLARATEWVQHPKGRRDTDTMPGSAGSSWYFLRYTDPHNSKAPFSFEAQKYWMPVDLYVGGSEHTVGHLLYSRFWHKVLFDCGLVSTPEPFKKLAHQGVVMGPDGQRMSKSRGNVVNPDDVREKYGVDASRLYICFLGPFDKDKPWDSKGIEGVRRFLDRVWRLAFDENGKVIADDQAIPTELERVLHKTIKKVGDDIEAMNFNTAISQMMILVNEAYRLNVRSKTVLLKLAQLLQPFAPFFAEEVWSGLGGQGFVSMAKWPSYDAKLVVDDTAEMGVQVNGKMRGTIQIPLTVTQDDAMAMALKVNTVANAIGTMAITKIIFKPGQILNIIVK